MSATVKPVLAHYVFNKARTVFWAHCPACGQPAEGANVLERRGPAFGDYRTGFTVRCSCGQQFDYTD